MIELVSSAQLLPSLFSSLGDNRSAANSRHSFSKAVFVFSLTLTRLIRSFHCFSKKLNGKINIMLVKTNRNGNY
jgi:hypothetical protein